MEREKPLLEVAISGMDGRIGWVSLGMSRKRAPQSVLIIIMWDGTGCGGEV